MKTILENVREAVAIAMIITMAILAVKAIF